MKKMGYLAIVPARASSKRLPGKNVLELCGVPLFLWSVKAGLTCPEITDVVVTTDSPQYQKLAIDAGALCPWLRSPELSSDHASSADVVLDVIRRFPDFSSKYLGIVLLQPTSPLRSAADISSAVRLHRTSQAPAVVSVCEAECPPAWVGQLGENGGMDDFVRPDYKGKRSQDLGAWYRLNGALYVMTIDAFVREHGFIPQGTLAYVMPRERSIDIDTAYDFELAQCVLARQLNQQVKC